MFSQQANATEIEKLFLPCIQLTDLKLVASEFSKGVEEFHYCATGMGSDDFVAFFFKDGKVVSKTTYNVTISDIGGVTGHCSKFVKRGTYRTPDNVVEIRATIN